VKARVESYLQLPFRVFVQMFPEAAEMLRDMPMYDDLLKDPRYIVRVTDGTLEIGYEGDAWVIS